MGAKKKVAKKRGKKKGVSRQAIQGSRKTVFEVDPEELTLIGRDTRHRSGADHILWDPRALADPDPVMVASIKLRGPAVPILVRKVDDWLEVVNGRRRTINCRRANIELEIDGLKPHKIQVKLVQGTDDEMFEMMVLTNALTRKPSPIESAHLLRRYLVFEGKTEAGAAEVFGVTSRTIKNWLALLKLDLEVQVAVGQGQLSSSAAAQFVGLSPKKQQRKLKQLVRKTPEGKRLSVTDAACGTGSASATQRAPSKKVVKKILALDRDVLSHGGLNGDFLLGVEWAIGQVGDADVQGMSELLLKVQG